MISENLENVINRIISIQKEFNSISTQYSSLFGKKIKTNPEKNTTNNNFQNNLHNNIINNDNNIKNKATIPVINTANQKYEYSDIINEAAFKYGFSPALLRAIIKVESNFNPKAISKAGAKGLMQLMPEIIKNFNVSNPFDPKQNILAGTKFLRELYEMFNFDIEKSLAAYNVGPNKIKKYGISEDIRKNYINKVFEYFREYGGF